MTEKTTEMIDEQIKNEIALTRIKIDPELPYDRYNLKTQKWETIMMYQIGETFYVTLEVYDKLKERTL